jgi:hypothetical protein
MQPCAADSEVAGHRREEIKKQNEGATMQEMSALLSAAWKEVSDEEKKPYNAAALAIKEDYEDILKTLESELLALSPDEAKASTAILRKMASDISASVMLPGTFDAEQDKPDLRFAVGCRVECSQGCRVLCTPNSVETKEENWELGTVITCWCGSPLASCYCFRP